MPTPTISRRLKPSPLTRSRFPFSYKTITYRVESNPVIASPLLPSTATIMQIRSLLCNWVTYHSVSMVLLNIRLIYYLHFSLRLSLPQRLVFSWFKFL